MRITCTLVYLLLFSIPVLAQDGTLDPTFGTSGKAYILPPGLNQSLSKTVVQSDGKVVIAGRATNCCGYDFSVARFKADGTPDETFDGDGFVVTEVITGAYDIITTVAVQPDGKIIAGGYSNNDFALVRYNVDGSLDNAFNGTGKVSTNLPGSSEIYALVVLGNGKILAAGASNPANGSYDFTLARYNADGTLDLQFDGDGVVTTAIGMYTDIIYSLAVQPDGKIVAAGSSNNGTGDDFTIVRYNADGSPDNSFNGNGKVVLDFGYNDIAYSVALQPDGKIVVAGVSNSADATIFNTAIARLLANGQPDNSFDGDGKASTAIGTYDSYYSVVVQQDGKIVAGGTTSSNGTSDFAIVRYNSDGSLDNSFDADGKLTLDMGGAEAYATLAGLNNKLYIGGYSNSGAGSRLAVARLNNSSALLVLAVKLLDFNAVTAGATVSLTWKIAYPENMLRFDVEQSEDGSKFTTIGTLPAKGGAGTDYTFPVVLASSGTQYYRLKMTDKNGAYTYSYTVAVKPGSRKEALQLLQNPVHDALHLQLATDEKTVLTIVDSKGAVIKKISGFATGNTSITVSIPGLASGVYHILLAGRSGLQQKTFVRD